MNTPFKSPDPQQSPFESFKTEAIPHPDTGELLRRLDVSERSEDKACLGCEFHGQSIGCIAPVDFSDDYFCQFPNEDDEWSAFNFIWVPASDGIVDLLRVKKGDKFLLNNGSVGLVQRIAIIPAKVIGETGVRRITIHSVLSDRDGLTEHEGTYQVNGRRVGLSSSTDEDIIEVTPS